MRSKLKSSYIVGKPNLSLFQCLTLTLGLWHYSPIETPPRKDPPLFFTYLSANYFAKLSTNSFHDMNAIGIFSLILIFPELRVRRNTRNGTWYTRKIIMIIRPSMVLESQNLCRSFHCSRSKHNTLHSTRWCCTNYSHYHWISCILFSMPIGTCQPVSSWWYL